MTKTRSGTASKPSYSRNVMPGNFSSKTHNNGRGDDRKTLRLHNKAGKSHGDLGATKFKQTSHAQHQHDPTVIVAPPPKKEIVLNRQETRFTLPDSPSNGAIRMSQIRRASATQALVLRELETELQCRSGHESPRVEMLN